MGRRVLRAHVDDHRLVVAPVDVDVARVDVAPLGEPEDGADLAAQLAAPVVRRGLSSWAPSEVSPTKYRRSSASRWRALGGLEPEILGACLAGTVGPFVAFVAHRGPGASLNCTGTRPTP